MYLRPRRFITHFDGLKDEFELMAEEIHALRKERDEYREKVETQAKELQDIRCNFNCERCRKGTVNDQIIASVLETAIPLSSTPVSPSNTLGKPDRSGTSRGVVPSQRSTQCVTPIQEPQAYSIPTQPTQFISQPNSQLVSLPPSLTVGPGFNPEEHDWSITFNNDDTKELDIEMVHTLFHEKVIHCVKFSQDGKYLAAGSRDGRAYIYEVHTGTLTCVCFNRNGNYLATGAQDARIYIWDIKTKHVRNAFKGHTDLINTLDFSPNGRLLVSTSTDNTVRLWDMRHGAAKVWTSDNPDSLSHHYYTSAVFSCDGRHVASSHADGMLRIWDVRTGQLMRIVKAHTDWVYDVAFMPDGKGLVSGGSDTNLEYWDISSLSATQRRASSHGHTASVYSLSITPNGRWIASGSVDKSVRIWDTRNAAMQCILVDSQWVYTVDFSSAGDFLVTGGKNGTVRIWRYSSTSRLEKTVY